MRREFPDRAASWYFAASERFLRGDVASALPLVRRAIELDASYADAHNLLGAIHATAGDIAAGRDAFRTSLRLDPRDAVTYVNLAQLELAAGPARSSLPTCSPRRSRSTRTRARRARGWRRREVSAATAP